MDHDWAATLQPVHLSGPCRWSASDHWLDGILCSRQVMRAPITMAVPDNPSGGARIAYAPIIIPGNMMGGNFKLTCVVQYGEQPTVAGLQIHCLMGGEVILGEPTRTNISGRASLGRIDFGIGANPNNPLINSPCQVTLDITSVTGDLLIVGLMAQNLLRPAPMAVDAPRIEILPTKKSRKKS